MAKEKGVGDWLLKSINGLGLLAVLGVVAVGTTKWNAVESVAGRLDTYQTEQKEIATLQAADLKSAMVEQRERDQAQDDIFSALNAKLAAVNANLAALNTKSDALQGDTTAIKLILMGRPLPTPMIVP